MGFLRFAVIGFVVLSIVYVCVSLYSRSVRREKLEDEWAEANPGSDDMAARKAYVDAGMVDYDGSFRKKLILLVYVVPPIIILAIIYLIN